MSIRGLGGDHLAIPPPHPERLVKTAFLVAMDGSENGLIELHKTIPLKYPAGPYVFWCLQSYLK